MSVMAVPIPGRLPMAARIELTTDDPSALVPKLELMPVVSVTFPFVLSEGKRKYQDMQSKESEKRGLHISN
jgi:hypothetical protein